MQKNIWKNTQTQTVTATRPCWMKSAKSRTSQASVITDWMTFWLPSASNHARYARTVLTGKNNDLSIGKPAEKLQVFLISPNSDICFGDPLFYLTIFFRFLSFIVYFV